jgi:hypothetical protein
VSHPTVVIRSPNGRGDTDDTQRTVVLPVSADRAAVVSPDERDVELPVDEAEKTVVSTGPETAGSVDEAEKTVVVSTGPETAGSVDEAEKTIVLPPVPTATVSRAASKRAPAVAAGSSSTAVGERDAESTAGLTRLIPAPPKDPPVFVDVTGRRRRRLRRTAYVLAALALVYTVLVGISFTGVTVSPDTLVPFLHRNEAPAPTPRGEPALKPTPAPSQAPGTPDSPRSTLSPT